MRTEIIIIGLVLGIALGQSSAWARRSGGSGGGGTLSCKGSYAKDTKVDSPHKILSFNWVKPMTFEVVVSSASDVNRVTDAVYHIQDSAGVEVAQFPNGNTPYSQYGALDVFFEGLKPGATYTLVIPTSDYCQANDGTWMIHNTYNETKTFTVPSLPQQELNAPVVSSEIQAVYGGIGGMITNTGFGLNASDDSYILTSEWFMDGVLKYSRRFDFVFGYSVNEPEAKGLYYFWVACYGPEKQTFISSVLTDIFGNKTTTSGYFSAPSCE